MDLFTISYLLDNINNFLFSKYITIIILSIKLLLKKTNNVGICWYIIDCIINIVDEIFIILFNKKPIIIICNYKNNV